MKRISFLLSMATAMSLSVFVNPAPGNSQALEPLPATPKNCIYFREVTSGQIQVRKRSQRGNENTDFAVPTGVRFTYYIAQLVPENNATYDAELFFKYNDGSNSRVFNKSIAGRRFVRQSATFRSPSMRQPFQINFRISTARNNAYQISLLGCK
ncbi:MAG TPA: hypothetical protein IGS53_19085 [Leptolyngbyaceae cyanobacterium M33_DOE_097]|uniref:DUF2808 domain-containing protein n=1 Tax=Oscillatoriales cyanobacterium SpSt-418 TaxID=2282169 RepID=A0A7C3KJ38_9CYAN|nr:hypothetical protein [Leptolyngbyaceae cyanobacterium M33_DOE_097]